MTPAPLPIQFSIWRLLCLLWAAKIFFLSTDAFSTEATRPFFARLLEQWHIYLEPANVRPLHTIVRKSTHLFEYVVFTLLLYRALWNQDRLTWHPRTARWCLLGVTVWSLSDELHQLFSTRRGASLADCAIDIAGAVLTLFVIRTIARSVPGRSASPRAEKASNVAVFDQDAFLRLLCHERKRTERSGRPFVLMLLDTGKLLKAGVDRKALDRVLIALAQSTCDSNIKGWYKTGRIIGVIFTEIRCSAEKGDVGLLQSRITSALGSTYTLGQIGELRLSFHVFPEEPSNNGDLQTDPVLYPDLWPDSDGKKGPRFVKRSIDIAGSLAALLFSAPVLLAVAAAIKLTSHGPILFRQQRVGQCGRRFTFLKFRSMYVASDESVHKQFVQSFIVGTSGGEHNGDGRAVFKLTNDSRITSIGNLLRRTSLDEFPQFFNVLKGEMSLVGPRPAIPYEIECYELWHRGRLLAKPGITGLWQVMGRSRVKFADMVRLDLRYVKTWTPWLDIKILLKTPGAVISGEGAF